MGVRMSVIVLQALTISLRLKKFETPNVNNSFINGTSATSIPTTPKAINLFNSETPNVNNSFINGTSATSIPTTSNANNLIISRGSAST